MITTKSEITADTVRELCASGYLRLDALPVATRDDMPFFRAGHPGYAIKVEDRESYAEDTRVCLALEAELELAYAAAARVLNLVRWTPSLTETGLAYKVRNLHLRRIVDGDPVRFTLEESISSSYLRTHPGDDEILHDVDEAIVETQRQIAELEADPRSYSDNVMLGMIVTRTWRMRSALMILEHVAGRHQAAGTGTFGQSTSRQPGCWLCHAPHVNLTTTDPLSPLPAVIKKRGG